MNKLAKSLSVFLIALTMTFAVGCDRDMETETNEISQVNTQITREWMEKSDGPFVIIYGSSDEVENATAMRNIANMMSYSVEQNLEFRNRDVKITVVDESEVNSKKLSDSELIIVGDLTGNSWYDEMMKDSPIDFKNGILKFADQAISGEYSYSYTIKNPLNRDKYVHFIGADTEDNYKYIASPSLPYDMVINTKDGQQISYDLNYSRDELKIVKNHNVAEPIEFDTYSVEDINFKAAVLDKRELLDEIGLELAEIMDRVEEKSSFAIRPIDMYKIGKFKVSSYFDASLMNQKSNGWGNDYYVASDAEWFETEKEAYKNAFYDYTYNVVDRNFKLVKTNWFRDSFVSWLKMDDEFIAKSKAQVKEELTNGKYKPIVMYLDDEFDIGDIDLNYRNEGIAFVSWLIENYGYDNWLKLYEEAAVLDGERALEKVYDKGIEELELEWIESLR